jgi:hypothetical protein
LPKLEKPDRSHRIGSHFIQEDSGPAIGRAVADWIKANSL